uniref:Uncharacterized protein n=1 Tax=Plectus sambesii TaxID=2011161 RepID=A0A914W643_9BILA
MRRFVRNRNLIGPVPRCVSRLSQRTLDDEVALYSEKKSEDLDKVMKMEEVADWSKNAMSETRKARSPRKRRSRQRKDAGSNCLRVTMSIVSSSSIRGQQKAVDTRKGRHDDDDDDYDVKSDHKDLAAV